MKILMPIFAGMLLAGCAASSGAVKKGQDVYTITTSASFGRGGLPAAKKQAYAEANELCESRHRAIDVTKEESFAPTWTDGMYRINLVFECKS